MDEASATGDLQGYDPQGYFCEMLGGPGRPAAFARAVWDRIGRLGLEELRARAHDAELELYNFGITFTVYTQKESIDRILPFDVIPRVISAEDWQTIETGVAEMCDLEVPFGTYVHVNGTDLVRDDDGRLLVLEDNARSPSGVSYVVENRHLMQRAFPDLMANIGIKPVSNYGQKLHEALAEIAPPEVDDPQVVLLSPGTYNSAYFEHIFLAREMGVPLVEGRDLLVEKGRVHMRTVAGLEPVHVVYRRINDDFLDPAAFNPDSMLGAAGLFEAYRKGSVALANAIGTGVADDKAVYAYMPRIIEYYLGEAPILSNVETHICREPEGLAYTLAHLDELVVKPVGESGGYGITIGPRASRQELQACREQLEADPANYISQPMVRLSVAPTLVEQGIEARHVDLRPFAVTGRSTWVLPGGLSRVALTKGSIVVNSSQGGGSKDTWVLE
jgi:uncharacterized circularly permuted ATP-grasp superfamily protein